MRDELARPGEAAPASQSGIVAQEIGLRLERPDQAKSRTGIVFGNVPADRPRVTKGARGSR